MMKIKIVLGIVIFSLFFNLPVFATSKYISYTIENQDFSIKRINKKYTKEIFKITNISKVPLKLEWSQQTNDITGQQVYDNTQYYATIGSQCVAFVGGLTIIGAPFAIYGATEMVKNKNAKLLNEINTYVKAGSVNWETIIQPNETREVHLIKPKTQTDPVILEVRFSGNNGKVSEEIVMTKQ